MSTEPISTAIVKRTGPPTYTEAENLARNILARMDSMAAKLKNLEADIRRLWEEFDKLKPGETILGCATKKEFCETKLHRTPRAIQYMLAGGNPNVNVQYIKPSEIISLPPATPTEPVPSEPKKCAGRPGAFESLEAAIASRYPNARIVSKTCWCALILDGTEAHEFYYFHCRKCDKFHVDKRQDPRSGIAQGGQWELVDDAAAEEYNRLYPQGFGVARLMTDEFPSEDSSTVERLAPQPTNGGSTPTSPLQPVRSEPQTPTLPKYRLNPAVEHDALPEASNCYVDEQNVDDLQYLERASYRLNYCREKTKILLNLQLYPERHKVSPEMQVKVKKALMAHIVGFERFSVLLQGGIDAIKSATSPTLKRKTHKKSKPTKKRKARKS